MLLLTNRLRCRQDDIVAKIMDGEAVIINLASGVYYSLDQVGAAMWDLIDKGLTLDEVAAGIAAGYDVPPAVAREDTLRLAGELMREELVVVEPAELTRLQPMPAAPEGAKLRYVSPQLNAYTDMEDLLALDPPTPGFADIPWKE